MENSIALITRITLDAWNTHIARFDKLLNDLSNEELENEVAPGRNTGIYILGHVVAVHDALFPLLGLGEKLYPELEEVFIKKADKSGAEKTPAKDLRNYWSQINKNLSEHFKKLAPEDWLQKHKSVSEEDFKSQPSRNRLNVLISRTNHLAYHLGQLIFLKK